MQYEFWFSDAQITDIHQVENAARYSGNGAKILDSGQREYQARQGLIFLYPGGKSGR
ncbi:hypothetical protein KCP76_16850 [Salmonella enterica subsp. enterica serovar Weltevreden]|nr:hypothetical protein KCP76_16850 [Salmonella enterica subsp. enterica serovar Weltevreden]